MTPLEVLASGPDQGQAYWFLDALSIVRFSGEQTGGSFALVEDHLPPGRATPYHVHEREDETFYVLDGQLTFFSEGRKFVGAPGATVFLPRQIPHGFRAETAARLLILTTPAGFDAFVAEAGEPAARLELPAPQPPDIAKLTAIAARYGIKILGPLPD